MRINSFKARNVHDYLNFDITFFSDLTFLIGINGSGKTSALKLLLGLTSPSFNYLTQISYEFCEVVCSSNSDEKDIVIRAEQNRKNNTLSISLRLNNEWFPTKASIKRLNKFIVEENDDNYDVEETLIIQQRLKESFDNQEIVKKIRDLTTPKFLGLDRRIYEGKAIDYRLHTLRNFRYKYGEKRIAMDTPAIDASLEEVQNLVYDYIRKISQQQQQFSEDFKQKIFSESFSFVQENKHGQIPKSIEDIVQKKQEVLLAIENLGIKYLDYSVNSFFNSIIEIINKLETFADKEKIISNDDSLNMDYLKILITWNNNSAQLDKIERLISYSQEYQKKIAELRSPMKRLEDIASNFLKEGNKKLFIEPDGEIKVELKTNKFANIFELSSGEKQIIIMIAHLIFEEDQKASGIFIIDEPELSLHIAWQEIFVDSIMEASPKTQFILATHAPSIVAKVDKEKYCQDLNKLNF